MSHKMIEETAAIPKGFYRELIGWFDGKPAKKSFYDVVDKWPVLYTTKCYRTIVTKKVLKKGDVYSVGKLPFQSASLDKNASLYAGANWANQSPVKPEETWENRAYRFVGQYVILLQLQDAKVKADMNTLLGLLKTAKDQGLNISHAVSLVKTWQEIWIGPKTRGTVIRVYDAHKFIDDMQYTKLKINRVKPVGQAKKSDSMDWLFSR